MNIQHIKNSQGEDIGSKIFLVGFMGSGKSHWAKQWAGMSGMDFYDLDAMIEKAEGRQVIKIFEESGEDYFRQRESEMLKDFARMNNFILACGGGTPFINEQMAWMNKEGITIYLAASPAYLLKNLMEEKQKRPLLKDMDDNALLSFIAQKLSERESVYRQARIILQAAELNDYSIADLHITPVKH